MDLMKEDIPTLLLAVVGDFLKDRECIVEVDGGRTEKRAVPLGCVQGSVLGPKLFNLYTSKIPTVLPPQARMVSYADDSYVIIAKRVTEPKDMEDLIHDVEKCINLHCKALSELGMVVNQGKTEAVLFTRRKGENKISFGCGSETIKTGDGMKVLGVHFDANLNWKTHIKNTINKMNRLTSGLKFLQKRLSRNQFLKATTSQFYGLCYYGSSLWLGPHTQVSQIRKLNYLHYRILRIATGV